jgi:protein-L-isoaspartate(D-aspartate) O-methyltransferase
MGSPHMKSWEAGLIMSICFFAMMHGRAGADQNDDGDRFAALRRQMVSHDLKARDISDPAVLAVMGKVPRHMFVEERFRSEAYSDHPLPLAEGQTISQPYIVALMTQYLKLKKTDRVLEIGTGSGYQAAVLAELAGRVYTIEFNKLLAGQAEKALRQLGYTNVRFRCGDGFFGWPEEAPFDAIILTCAPGQLPQPLIDQLREGGRIMAPIGGELQVQELLLGTKTQGRIIMQNIASVRFVPMRGEAEKKTK